jgi:hypothetical protein
METRHIGIVAGALAVVALIIAAIALFQVNSWSDCQTHEHAASVARAGADNDERVAYRELTRAQLSAPPQSSTSIEAKYVAWEKAGEKADYVRSHEGDLVAAGANCS